MGPRIVVEVGAARRRSRGSGATRPWLFARTLTVGALLASGCVNESVHDAEGASARASAVGEGVSAQASARTPARGPGFSAADVPSTAALGQEPALPVGSHPENEAFVGGLLLRARAQRFAHPEGGAVVRVALAVTNVTPEARTVNAADFSLGAARPWAAGQRFTEVALAPGQSAVGMLAFRVSPSDPASSVPEADATVRLGYIGSEQSPGGVMSIAARAVSVDAATVRAVEAMAEVRARPVEVPRELLLRVDAVTVVQRTGYLEQGVRLDVVLTAVNLSAFARSFRAERLRVHGAMVEGGPVARSGELFAANQLGPLQGLSGTVSFALAQAPAQDFDVRISFGEGAKLVLDEVHTVVAPTSLLGASTAVAATTAPMLAPGKQRTLGIAAAQNAVDVTVAGATGTSRGAAPGLAQRALEVLARGATPRS